MVLVFGFWILIFCFHSLFFVLCALGLSPFNRESLPGRAASGSSLQRVPRPALGPKSRRVRAKGWSAQKKDLKASSLVGDAGPRLPASPKEGLLWRARPVGG